MIKKENPILDMAIHGRGRVGGKDIKITSFGEAVGIIRALDYRHQEIIRLPGCIRRDELEIASSILEKMSAVQAALRRQSKGTPTPVTLGLSDPELALMRRLIFSIKMGAANDQISDQEMGPDTQFPSAAMG